MNLIANTVLAFSMSADAFAVAVCKGAAIQKPRLKDALRIGAVFGCVEALTPIIGWLLGLAASSFIEAIDHWIAFGILTLIGGKMIFEGLQNKCPEEKKSHKFHILALTAIGTSIDAMAVGVTLALLNANILLISAMIGMATFTMVTIGIMTGHYVGTKAGRVAEFLGGLCLILIGSKILTEHLGLL